MCSWRRRHIPIAFKSTKAGGRIYVPRITDFGIAKLFGSEDCVTATVAVLGTAAYMAPEQAEGKAREVRHSGQRV